MQFTISNTSQILLVADNVFQESIKMPSHKKSKHNKYQNLKHYSNYLVSDNFTAVNCSGGLGPSSPEESIFH